MPSDSYRSDGHLLCEVFSAGFYNLFSTFGNLHWVFIYNFSIVWKCVVQTISFRSFPKKKRVSVRVWILRILCPFNQTPTADIADANMHLQRLFNASYRRKIVIYCLNFGRWVYSIFCPKGCKIRCHTSKYTNRLTRKRNVSFIIIKLHYSITLPSGRLEQTTKKA